MFHTTTSGAEFSPDRIYRFLLWRNFRVPPRPPARNRYAMFIGLNPSTADETLDDPTIRRCIRYAKDWGYDGLYMLNIFAFRATDPKVMKAHQDPVGPGNDEYLQHYAKDSEVVIAAWGTHGSHLERGRQVSEMLGDLKCFGTTKDGHPKHPLYLRADLGLVPFTKAAVAQQGRAAAL